MTHRSGAATVDQYVAEIDDPRRFEICSRLVEVIRQHLPVGFDETMEPGAPSWLVPWALYPAGYHTTPTQRLWFLTLINQKSSVALHHFGLYADTDLADWFRSEWATTGFRLDMGASCIRFTRPDRIPYDLIGELLEKLTPQQWVELYAVGDPRNRTKR